MTIITKEEAEYLRSSGRGGDVHVSSITKKSRGKRYYATESVETMRKLSEYRKSLQRTQGD